MSHVPLRIAIGTIFTECNQFGGIPIDLAWFERYELRRGDEMLTVNKGVMGGMLEVLGRAGHTPVPTIYASAGPGGPLTAACYAQLKGELLDCLAACLPVDGVLLPLHGAAVAEETGDLEGDLICAVREVVGWDVPIVATLDLHAHVTDQMVTHADALLAWETYPHADSFSTGMRGAQMIVDMLAGRCHPTMAMAKVPVITGAINGSTHGDDPFAVLMRQTKAHEGDPGVLSTSLFLVHPYLDQPGMGSGALVITDGNMEQAVATARKLALSYWARRFDLEPVTWTPAEAVSAGINMEGGPVLLVETADCCGGGAAGDSVASLGALLPIAPATGPEVISIVPVADPEVASVCHKAGVGAEITVKIGHKLDPRWGEPILVTGRVERLSDGYFHYEGGIFEGVQGEMGPSAVLAVGGVRILVTTHATYDWRDEQYRAVDLDPAKAKFVVVKNPMNYRMAYGAFARAIFVLATPGPTPATVRNMKFEKLARPYFPLDQEIPDLQPMILRGPMRSLYNS